MHLHQYTFFVWQLIPIHISLFHNTSVSGICHIDSMGSLLGTVSIELKNIWRCAEMKRPYVHICLTDHMCGNFSYHATDRSHMWEWCMSCVGQAACVELIYMHSATNTTVTKPFGTLTKFSKSHPLVNELALVIEWVIGPDCCWASNAGRA